MSPVMRMGGEGAEPSGMRPHLVLKLKAGWRLDEPRGVFVSAKGEQVDPRDKLPKGSAIMHMAPSVARRDPADLLEEERNLARYVQVALPKGKSPSTYLKRMQGLACVEEGRLPPKISLPSR